MKDAMPRLVLVEWVDSYCSTGWRELDEMRPEVMRCRSAGWIASEDHDCIVLTPHVTDEDHSDAPAQGNGIMVIPKRAIIALTDLSASPTVTLTQATEKTKPDRKPAKKKLVVDSLISVPKAEPSDSGVIGSTAGMVLGALENNGSESGLSAREVFEGLEPNEDGHLPGLERVGAELATQAKAGRCERIEAPKSSRARIHYKKPSYSRARVEEHVAHILVEVKDEDSHR